MFCPNCRRQLPDGTKFCGGCGTPITAPIPTPAAPAEPVDPTPAPNPVPAPQPEKPDVAAEVKKAAGKVTDAAKKIPSKYLKIGGIALAALLVIILLASLFGGSGSDSFLLYIKEDQVYLNDFSSNAPYEITDDLLDGADNEDLYYAAEAISNGIHITENGKTMFYLDKADESSATGTLYYRSLTNMKKEAEKISGGVSLYAVSADGKTVTYLKGTTLYQHNLKEETKIAKNVDDGFYVSEDGKIVYYYDEDGTLYAYYKGESEKVGSEVSLYYLSEDMKTAYYMDEDTLYSKTLGQDKDKLATDVYSAFGFTDAGTFYYVEAVTVKLSSYFTWEEDYDYWKESLDAYGETELYYTLNYFDGKAKTVVATACSYPTSAYSDDSCAVFYTLYNEEVQKFTMEELSTAYYESYSLYDAASNLITSAMSKDAANYLAIGSTATEVDVENVYKFRFSPDGKTIYLLCDVEEDEGDLYSASVSGTKVGALEEVDDSVSSRYGCYFLSGSNYFYYFKDVDGYEAELCVNGESVADDVYVYGVRYNEKNDELAFYADYNSDNSEGTLCAYNGKKVTEIADDVHSFQIAEDGKIAFIYDYKSGKSKGTLGYYNGKKVIEVSDDVFDYTFDAEGNLLYLYDYSTSSYRGDLALFNGKKSQEIDEDVVALIYLSSSYYHSLDD